MHVYDYRLLASRELYGERDTLTGTINSPHPLTEQEIRDQAINVSPRDYIHFTELTVEQTK